MKKQQKITYSLFAALILMTGGQSSAETLKQAVEQTLRTNPDIQVNIRESNARQEEVKQAKAGYLPSIDVTAGYGKERSNNSTTRTAGYNDRTLQRGEAAIEVTQNLYDGLATKHEIDRQRARVQSAGFSFMGSAEHTALRAIEVYLDVLKQKELLSQSRTNFSAHEHIQEQVKARSDAGVSRGSDLNQVDGRLALARTNVISDESNLNDAKTNYLRVVGSLPGSDLNTPSFPSGRLPSSLDEAITKAEANNPVLLSAKADVDAAAAQFHASKSAFRPRFDLELGKTWNNNLDGVEGTNEDTTAMLRMRFNLLNGGADLARKNQTVQLLEEAKEVKNSTQRQVVENIRLTWNGYKAINNQMGYLKSHYDSSMKTRDAYTKQFSIGKRTLLDLLDTENEMFEASRAYINAKYDSLYARYRIMAGMGMLNETLGVNVR